MNAFPLWKEHQRYHNRTDCQVGSTDSSEEMFWQYPAVTAHLNVRGAIAACDERYADATTIWVSPAKSSFTDSSGSEGALPFEPATKPLTGYVLSWQLAELGVECEVVAPTLVPVKAGDRVKTDRRDAEKLARCYRSGDLRAVWVPDEGSEALRDLVRAREAAKQDQTRARHRLSKFLLRRVSVHRLASGRGHNLISSGSRSCVSHRPAAVEVEQLRSLYQAEGQILPPEDTVL